MITGSKPKHSGATPGYAAFLAALLLFTGCAIPRPMEGKPRTHPTPPATTTTKNPPKTANGPFSEQALKETRQEATRRLNYSGTSQELTPGSHKLDTAEVSVGGTITQTLEYTVLDPDAKRRIQVTKAVFIIPEGQKPLLLTRVATKEEQGTHVLKAQITLPAAIDPGLYTITTVLDVGGTKKQVSSTFKITAARNSR